VSSDGRSSWQVPSWRPEKALRKVGNITDYDFENQIALQVQVAADANPETVGGAGTRFFRPHFVEIDPWLPPMLHSGDASQVDLWGQGPPG
jgi:hypothetical protein